MKTTHIGRRSRSARYRPSRWLLSGPWWGRMYRGDCSHATEPRRSTTCDCPPFVQIDMTPYRNSPVVSTSHGKTVYIYYTYTGRSPNTPRHLSPVRFIHWCWGDRGVVITFIEVRAACCSRLTTLYSPSIDQLVWLDVQTSLVFTIKQSHCVFNLVLVPCSLVGQNELWQKRKCAFRETIKYPDSTC